MGETNNPAKKEARAYSRLDESFFFSLDHQIDRCFEKAVQSEVVRSNAKKYSSEMLEACEKSCISRLALWISA